MTFRHKLLVFGLAVAALTAVCVFVAGGLIVRASVSDRMRERLEKEAAVLADWLAGDRVLVPDPTATGGGAIAGALGAGLPGPETDSAGSGPAVDDVQAGASGAPRATPSEAPCDEFADRAGERLGLRVTVVAPDGRVIGDSALDGEDLARMDNHAHRPEIVDARSSGFGWSIRTSRTVHDELYYAARRIDRDGHPVGYVRLAIEVPEIQRVTGGYSESLAAFSFVVLMAVALVGYVAARRFSQPIEEMSRTADAIASGRRDLEVEYGSEDEIGRLGAAFNRMTRALSEQIAELSKEKRLRDTILGGMKEGILVLGADRRVLLCNDALRTFLGQRGQDPVGRPLIEIARDRAIIEGFDSALVRGEEYREIVRIGPRSERAFEITVAPLTDAAGLQVGAIGLFFDVTRLTALESVRREFVADVSHELRSPLTSIKAFVETLLAGGLEDAANNRRFLEIIKKHSDRMEAILDDLTDLSLIETGAVALERERLDLAVLVHDLVESVKPKADLRGISVSSEVSPGTAVTADRRRLEQILLNLLDNAIKFNRTGGSVTVRAEPDAAGRALRIEVTDTGIGLPADAVEKVFLRFYRVDRARSRELGGTGLGLSIVKHLMRIHGGSVRVESEIDRGCRFILEFPSEPDTTSA